MERALLLNFSYEPLRVISWQRAVTLSFLGKVEVIDTYDRYIRSVSVAIKAPAVVRLLRYVKIPKRRVSLSRTAILKRDEYACQYCGKKLTLKDATVDHVIPRSKGGKTIWSNVVTACAGCNRKKGDRTPAQAGMQLVKKPREPSYWMSVSNSSSSNVPHIWQAFISLQSY